MEPFALSVAEEVPFAGDVLPAEGTASWTGEDEISGAALPCSPAGPFPFNALFDVATFCGT
ncbi:hypothetical protein [Amycolatopsis sp. YIM 10]|uniref:hypothetical protein n=1 Tax=Amycolatopsis sp. YIM 10 TaxID=2653857 RepID=UPI0012907853|nr:hypothetical protein [Amycolatopsis sp. YIM 10]QFU90262.1 hypothetical protein YIM_25430 [Amycolatopsis sp. YIM 10]